MSLFTKMLTAPKFIAHSLQNGNHADHSHPAAPLPRISDSHADEIAVISHELRNSLGVVRNAARLLRFSPDKGCIDGARVLIERHVGQMSRHLGDLLEASRDGQKVVLQPTHADLRTIVEFAVSAVMPDMVRHGHRLTVALPPEAIWVHADVTRLEQVFSNLLINAAKYTPDGGDITVSLERVGSRGCIHVCDSGIGISPEMLGRIFQLFAQVDSKDPRAEGGRGIGLAVVRKLVEAHGGSVQATSGGLGMGSQFTVSLPALWGQANTDAPQSSAR